MFIIKMLIGIPIIAILLVFAFVNNDLATFSLWPFNFEATVSLSVATLFFVVLGFVLGVFFLWLSYAPIRASLRNQKKQNKKLNKTQQKLIKEMEVLQENLDSFKPLEEEKKPSLGERLKSVFSFKRAESSEANDKI